MVYSKNDLLSIHSWQPNSFISIGSGSKKLCIFWKNDNKKSCSFYPEDFHYAKKGGGKGGGELVYLLELRVHDQKYEKSHIYARRRFILYFISSKFLSKKGADKGAAF